MLLRRIITQNVYQQCKFTHEDQGRRHIQVTLVGAASEIGSNVAVLLKNNDKITRLNLYDDDEKIHGLGYELSVIPEGPCVYAYGGNPNLVASMANTNLVVMVARAARRLGYAREAMLYANAPAIQRVCKAYAETAPNAFLAISTSPLNSIIPFASVILNRYGALNPFKLFGITHIDTCRCRALAAEALHLNPKDVLVPVIGGHSEPTMIPLFSNMTPSNLTVGTCHADMLTRLVRKAGSQVVTCKRGQDSSILTMAWSISEFVNGIVEAIDGRKVVVNSYVINPYYGTRFFGGPTTVGMHGIIETGHGFRLSEFEQDLLKTAVPLLNRDVEYGEAYVRMIDCIEKRL